MHLRYSCGGSDCPPGELGWNCQKRQIYPEFVRRGLQGRYVVVTGTDHMGFSDAGLLDARFSGETPSNYAAYERALLTSELTRSLVEEFFGKYLKHSSAPELDVLFHVDKK